MLNYAFLYEIFYMAPATKFYPTSYYKLKSKLIAINRKYISTFFYVKNTILNQNANNKDSNLTTRHFF